MTVRQLEQLSHEIRWLESRLRHELMSVEKRKEYVRQIKHKNLTIEFSLGGKNEN